MAAYRCSICAINWPTMNAYEVCPKCEGKTRRFSDEDPLTPEQAQYKRKEIAFDAYYEERGERPLLPKHAAEIAGPIAAAEHQHQMEMWWLLHCHDDG